MVGLGYGFVSGATAGGIGLYWRPADYGRVAGRTYIAWCLAAVSLPVLAGYLFDMTRAYSTADGAHDAETRLEGERMTALRLAQRQPVSAYSLNQYWVVPPPLDAPLALSCLIRCISMLEELVAPL